jgi:hypothetical protein
MALSPASQSNKICATCNYWSGVRQAPKNSTTIYVDNHTPSICLFFKSNIPKKTKSTDKCSKWEKWSLI